MAVVSGSVPGMSLASLGQAFVSAGPVSPAISSPVPMLPLADQRFRASGDGRLFRLGSAPASELGAEVQAAIDEVYQEAYPEDAPAREEQIAEQATTEEAAPEAEAAADESASEETEPAPEEAQTEQEPPAEETQPAAEEAAPEEAAEEEQPAAEEAAPEEAAEEEQPAAEEAAPEEAAEEEQPAAEEAAPEEAAEEEQPAAEEAAPEEAAEEEQPAAEEAAPEEAAEEEQPAAEEAAPEEAAEEEQPAAEEEQPAAEEEQPAEEEEQPAEEEPVSEEAQAAPEEEQPAAEESSEPAAEDSSEPEESATGQLAQPESSGVTDVGQPSFTTTSNPAYDAFRKKGFEADQKALAAGDDDKKAASAYIFDDDDAASAFLGGERRDLLAEAMRDDPVRHAYLPPMFEGFDMQDPNWKHQPLQPRDGGLNKFKVCLDQGAGSWDAAYASNTLFDLFRGGVCFNEVTESACEDADVVIFNEGVFLWGGGHRNAQGAIELPKKSDPNQVYLYFAHEAAGTFGWELKDENVMKQFDYLAYFDRETSAVWWPFGPTVRSMLQDFKFFARPRDNRVPGVAWLATDCKPLRATIAQEIAEKFPVFSIGPCQNNAPTPFGLPGRGDGDAGFQDVMSNYMFYFAVENGGACPAYATEKVFLALTRGSVPIYFGDEKTLSIMPSRDAFIDLATFDTPEKLAARLHAIATDQEAYDEVHAWRYRHPSEWSEGFRSLLRVMSTDIKYGVCDVLRKGADAAPKSAPQADCDYSVNVMGRTVGAWPDHGGIRDPLEHLNKKCEHAKAECWEFKNPNVYEKWGEQATNASAAAENEAHAARRFLRR
jgi:hypothetical protein